MDKGRREAEKQLNRVKRELSALYAQAGKRAEARLVKHLERYEAEDEEMRHRVEEGEIDEIEYEDWRYRAIASGREWEKTRNEIANEYTKANSDALKTIGVVLPIVFMSNYNFMADKLSALVKTVTNRRAIPQITTTKYLKGRPELLPKNLNIPADQRWNQRKINSQLRKAIKSGESIPKIAKRMQKVTDMNDAAAVRNARTMVTAAENGARQATAEFLFEHFGIYTHKQWVAVGDERTRESHLAIDGEIVPYNQPFSNKCDYPADPYGPLDEVYNCRCSADYIIKNIFRGKIER